MPPDIDQDASNTALERLTVAGAAERLGVSQDAVRKRIQRNTILWEKDDEGRIYVFLDPSETSQADEQDPSNTALEIMQDQVDYLKDVIRSRDEELRRKDTIIMSLTQRIPELEPAPEPPESPENAGEGSGGTQGREEPQETISRPWWRRWLGG